VPGDVVEIQPGTPREVQLQALRQAVQSGRQDIWLVGPASANKAALVDDLAREMQHYPAHTYDTAFGSAGDLIGAYMATGRNEYRFMPTTFPRDVQEGKWVKLTRIDQADSNNRFCLQGLKDGETLTIGDLKAHPNTRFFVLLDT